MPIFDYRCENPTCPAQATPVERLVRKHTDKPACEQCNTPMEQQPLSYHQFGPHANQCSLRFNFNYLDR